jgi:hypothetical protein
MAPEQARGDDVSPRTDIYALGVMAYELITGELPFTGPGPMEVLMRHVSAPIPSARALVPSLPEPIEVLLKRMMAKSPFERVQTVEEVRELLIETARVLGPAPAFDTLDVVSGEHRGLPIRPIVTPANSGPAIEAALHEDTLVRQPSVPPGATISVKGLQPRRWPWVVGLLLIIGGLSVALFTVGNSKPPAPVPVVEPRPAAAQDAEQRELGAKELAAKELAAKELAAKELAAKELAAKELAAKELAAKELAAKELAAKELAAKELAAKELATKEPAVEKRGPPTGAALRERVTRLELALQRVTPAGEEPDPSALSLLRKYRVEATMVESVEDRRTFAKKLDTFERSFLKP